MKFIDKLERFMLKTKIKVFLATLVVEIAKEVEKRKNPRVIQARPHVISEVITIHSVNDGRVTIIDPQGHFITLSPGDTFHLDLETRDT